MKVKVAISQPMNGKTREQVEQERKRIIDAVLDSGNSYVNTVLTEKQLKNSPMWCLGASLQKISKADIVVFMPGWSQARGCKIEHDACMAYGLRTVEFNDESPMNLNDDIFNALIGAVIEQAMEQGAE